MRKFSILFLAAFAIIACSNSSETYKVENVTLKSQIDSLNYFVGYCTGISIQDQEQGLQGNAETITDFVNALEAAYNGAEEAAEYENLNERQSKGAFYIGHTIREQERESGLMGIEGLETDFDLIKRGFINGLFADTSFITPEVAYAYMNATMEPLARAQYERNSNKNKLAGEEFLAENAKRPEVKTTASGLQYEVLVPGNGPKPKATSTVKVHYEGTFIDGKVFDSSYSRGEPIEFPLNGVIKGWTEGLQLMPVGSTYMLYIPYDLAYGEMDRPSLPAYSTLIFKVELLEIK